MRNNICVCLLLLLCFSNKVLSQNIVDSVDVRCFYKLNYINDLEKINKIGEEEMMLLIGDQYTMFYSYSKFVMDSLREANPAEYMPRTVNINGQIRMGTPLKKGPKSENSDRSIINRVNGELICMAQIITSDYMYKELLKKPIWKIGSETKEMLGYICQNATTNYGGREWTVWFTTEIAINEGPWLLRGLPGLILKAEDSEKHYVFECLGVERLKQKQVIAKPTNGNYRLISKREFFKQQQTFFDNPIKALISTDARLEGNLKYSGPEIKRKYNPIERID